MTGVTVKDRRRLPFVMVTKAAIEAIRDTFDNRRGQTALAVYVGIVECANDARSDSFEVTRRELAGRGQVHVKSLDSYVAKLEQLGLVRVDRADGVPNRWTLTDPPAADQGVQGSRVNETVGSPALPRAESTALPGVGSPGLPGLVKGEKKGKKTKKETKPTASLQSRGDLVGLSHRLGDAIKASDPKATLAPESTAWLDPLRLLIDRDGRAVEEVAAVIDWCQTDDFERRNVLSPSKLRKRFTELLLKAQAAGAVQLANTTPIDFRRTASPNRLAQPDDQAAAVEAQTPTSEIAAEWARIRRELMDAAGQGAIAVLAPLHPHTSEGVLALGCPSTHVGWVRDRFGRLIADIAGRPIEIIDCRCPQEQAA